MKIYWLVIHLVVVLLLLSSPWVEPLKSRFGFYAGEAGSFWQTMLNLQQRQLAQMPHGTVVIVGDSMVQGLWPQGLAPNTLALGVAGDTTVGVLKRLQQFQGLEKASVIVLAVGVNDMKRRSAAQALENYHAMIEALPASVPVVISGVLPIDEATIQVDWNPRIRRFNQGLVALAQQCARCEFAAVPAAFVYGYGLLPRFHEGDGLHLNAQGYKIWMSQLQGSLSKL